MNGTAPRGRQVQGLWRLLGLVLLLPLIGMGECWGDDTAEPIVCGDGLRESGEDCDEGAANSDTTPDACRTDCRSSRCGDGVVDPGHDEVCDDGNVVDGDGCNHGCRSTEVCGNGVVDEVNGETCDEGDENSDAIPDACREDCRGARCGDGVVDPGHAELCDPGGADPAPGCNPDCTSALCGNGQLDLAEQCDDGNRVSHDGCASRCVAESFLWTHFLGGPLIVDAAGTFDASSLVTVVFGGSDQSGRLDDTWTYDGRTGTWRQSDANVRPRPRQGAALAFLPASGGSVLFGGETAPGQVAADTWVHDAVADRWTRIYPAIVPPSRAHAAMTYDASRHCLVLFGGEGEEGLLADTWEFDGAEWLERTMVTAPSPRRRASLAPDPVGGGLLLFGGQDVPWLADTWRYDGATWTELDPDTRPGTAGGSSMVVHPVAGRIFLVNGE